MSDIKEYIDNWLLENPNKGNKMYYRVLENSIVKNEALLLSLYNNTSFLSSDVDIRERIYYIKNGISKNIALCGICGGPTKFHRMETGYNMFCSKICQNKDPDLRRSISTSLKTYHSGLTEEDKKTINYRIEATNLEKYGVRRPSQNKLIKDKIEQTGMSKYGVKYSFNSNKVIEKNNIRSLEKYKLKFPNIEIVSLVDGIFNIVCNKCGNTSSIPYNNLSKRSDYGVDPCIICNPLSSCKVLETEIYDFIRESYDGEVLRNRRILKSGREVDIYVPDKGIGIEHNGVYWHNELYVSNDYHLTKKLECKDLNIDLIHIYEDDWSLKKDICKSILLNKLGLSKNKIYARKCQIKRIDGEACKNFLISNHIQGNFNSPIRLGLFYKDALVSVMTFGNTRVSLGSRPKENNYELIRFCNLINTNVIGGASKLFKYFIDLYNPSSIISYASYDRSSGKMYEILGFSLSHLSRPNYYYVVDGIRKHRYAFTKHKLVSEGYDSNKTEEEIMRERKIYRIFDCGNLKYVWNNGK